MVSESVKLFMHNLLHYQGFVSDVMAVVTLNDGAPISDVMAVVTLNVVSGEATFPANVLLVRFRLKLLFYDIRFITVATTSFSFFLDCFD